MNKIELVFLLKSKLAEQGLNITKLAEHLDVTPQNISQRVKKGTFDYLEICEIVFSQPGTTLQSNPPSNRNSERERKYSL